MLNYETILSSYDDKLTLMQWLKKVEAALKDASAVSFKVNKKGDATLTFSIVFEDGSEIESGEIVLQQGESVESAAIVNGHLILTLTNGDELDAGQLLNGDLNVSGNLAVTGKITGAEIVEDMAGYSFTKDTSTQFSISYAGVVKNGNKITFAIAGIMNLPAADDRVDLGYFTIPASVGQKLFPIGSTIFLSYKVVPFYKAYNSKVDVNVNTIKVSDTRLSVATYTTALELGTDYSFRYEITFLLSENLAE